ncbi:DEKNAAC105115 [Brettanomyces naardenensis]|uniref:Probable cytosolic iron-sulfur protein assembly protein 1 n=1 Tax=Brettanomyces naardenensis TaxID=13370 RepID=A0A448YSR5_BRENA|nr:DEKNAAC105115 [Brettanomyces naardenensis]
MPLTLEYTFEAHKTACWAVAVHPQLQLIATVSGDKTCKIFDLESKQLLATLGDGTHSKTTRCASFKPSVDFPTVAVGSFDGTVSIWGRDLTVDEEEDEEAGSHDASSTTGESDWELLAVIEGHENEVKSVDWSHDGRYLATCSRDKSAWIWETDDTNEEFECINVIQEHDQDVKHVTWHPRENLLATCSYDETCRVFRQDPYDEDDWMCVAKLDDAEGTVWSSAFEKFSEEGIVRLVTCSDDTKVRVYRKQKGAKKSNNGDIPPVPSSLKDEEEWVLEAVLPQVHDRPIYSVDWSDDGMIVSGGCDGRIGVYREVDGKWQVVATQERAHGVYEINCVKWWDGKVLSAGDDGKVKLWQLTE